MTGSKLITIKGIMLTSAFVLSSIVALQGYANGAEIEGDSTNPVVEQPNTGISDKAYEDSFYADPKPEKPSIKPLKKGDANAVKAACEKKNAHGQCLPPARK